MWLDYTKAALKKLKIAYNNSLRRFMFLPWRKSATEMFENLGIHSFDEMLRIFVFSFRSRVTASHNQLRCFWIEDFIEINKRQQTHHTHTKYNIYIK